MITVLRSKFRYNMCYSRHKLFKVFAVMQILVMFLIFMESTGWAKNRALLIGINYGGVSRIRHLSGCIADVHAAKQMLARFGFRDTDIKLLTESEATWAGIEAAFRSQLIEGSQPGDLILFYFSGHGTQANDLNNDESDGLDEALVPWDTIGPDGKLSRLLIDDDLGKWISELRDRQVIVIIDSCHSGTATKGIESVRFITNPDVTPLLTSRDVPAGNSAKEGIQDLK
ncbi:MAG: hypothetical protein A2Y62_12315 [Candidatus Fischerbacteria bacterium RBG_13_37_8]|uniref:Peptidase C14 caspase domain-containing protein n=1 Tax=Candidatus Fischerbacteria bacterium RBG_13_37_8 TaxID=1817863 RepID=A0A1F5VDL7_9BACT|nr:MAG: hypothetical protein A2Y62_12315 [Candidatus Fischerbacteria bacterium RBG_13_37_8]